MSLCEATLLKRLESVVEDHGDGPRTVSARMDLIRNVFDIEELSGTFGRVGHIPTSSVTHLLSEQPNGGLDLLDAMHTKLSEKGFEGYNPA